MEFNMKFFLAALILMAGAPMAAVYNGPLMPFFLRRNEVLGFQVSAIEKFRFIRV